MGKTKIKVIDDFAPEVEEKKSKPKKKVAKSSEFKTTGEVESTQEEGTSTEPTSQQTHSEAQDTELELSTQGEPSGILQPGEQSSPNKASRPGKAKPRSKKYQEVSKDLDRSKTYPLSEAVDMVKKMSYSKFNGTLEIHINTAQMGIRGLVSLPYASGKKLRLLAFGKGAPSSGANLVGDDNTIEEISQGKVNFDVLVTTPEWMPKLAKLARILGPRGLMPNPKNSTITEDLKKTVESFQAGKTEYKTESKAPVIHLSLGKLNQPDEELAANIKTLVQTLGKTRVKKVSLAPTMGPSVKVDLASL